ncbi:14654_t:CDS:1, partial [Funneliformis geosporum]
KTKYAAAETTKMNENNSDDDLQEMTLNKQQYQLQNKKYKDDNLQKISPGNEN